MANVANANHPPPDASANIGTFMALMANQQQNLQATYHQHQMVEQQQFGGGGGGGGGANLDQQRILMQQFPPQGVAGPVREREAAEGTGAS